MLRTVDGRVRGLLSSRYRILDSYDMLETILPLAEDRGLQVVSSEITERRLFLKLLSPRLTSEVQKGDVVQYGLACSTSDVGAGSVRVEPFIHRLVCLNGMISTTAVRKFHVGKNQSEFDIQELLSDRTKEVVELAMKATGVTGEGKKNGILAALASGNEGAGLTQWGLINAFTRAAQSDAVDYEASIEMERAAGQILELPRKDWTRIAESVA